MPLRLNAADPAFASDFSAFVAARRGVAENVAAAVADIIADVRKRGSEAVLDYTRRFDGLDLAASGDLVISADEIASACDRCDPAQVDALEFAAARIRAFHERQRPDGFSYIDEDGVRLGLRWTPVSSAGIYVPGGEAAYPSSALMNAIPAAVAGVARIVMAVPTPGGAVNPLVLAAAEIAGVEEVHRMGGAQAIAALAWGTDVLDPVDKIAGPGNVWVAEAKRQAFGAVGIDMIAGPSEILVVADRENDPAWIAADLLSQAEHDACAQAILITDDADFADAVEAAAQTFLETLPRAEIADASWGGHGAVMIVGELADAPPLVDRIAPEHLELAVADPDPLAERVRHAGAIFFGRHTPEAVGDYVAGPNHVLPTDRSARYSSGLGVVDFMKRTTLVRCDHKALKRIGPAAATLADAEGLAAHALSVSLRLGGAER